MVQHSSSLGPFWGLSCFYPTTPMGLEAMARPAPVQAPSCACLALTCHPSPSSSNGTYPRFLTVPGWLCPLPQAELSTKKGKGFKGRNTSYLKVCTNGLRCDRPWSLRIGCIDLSPRDR